MYCLYFVIKTTSEYKGLKCKDPKHWEKVEKLSLKL
jgi:hypothetical protein